MRSKGASRPCSRIPFRSVSLVAVYNRVINSLHRQKAKAAHSSVFEGTAINIRLMSSSCSAVRPGEEIQKPLGAQPITGSRILCASRLAVSLCFALASQGRQLSVPLNENSGRDRQRVLHEVKVSLGESFLRQLF